MSQKQDFFGQNVFQSLRIWAQNIFHSKNFARLSKVSQRCPKKIFMTFEKKSAEKIEK